MDRVATYGSVLIHAAWATVPYLLKNIATVEMYTPHDDVERLVIDLSWRHPLKKDFDQFSSSGKSLPEDVQASTNAVEEIAQRLVRTGLVHEVYLDSFNVTKAEDLREVQRTINAVPPSKRGEYHIKSPYPLSLISMALENKVNLVPWENKDVLYIRA